MSSTTLLSTTLYSPWSDGWLRGCSWFGVARFARVSGNVLWMSSVRALSSTSLGSRGISVSVRWMFSVWLRWMSSVWSCSVWFSRRSLSRAGSSGYRISVPAQRAVSHLLTSAFGNLTVSYMTFGMSLRACLVVPLVVVTTAWAYAFLFPSPRSPLGLFYWYDECPLRHGCTYRGRSGPYSFAPFKRTAYFDQYRVHSAWRNSRNVASGRVLEHSLLRSSAMANKWFKSAHTARPTGKVLRPLPAAYPRRQ
jgi:hypothetical protein